VEDWEQFFEEKSRRRANKDRRRDWIKTLQRLALAALTLAALAALLILQK
jgi:hypothetical protein